ncbi:hypothetical protein [Streptomyces sp. NPDC002132]|uniref:hypothetical protein n=1 Tax=unclassified Streptomyces TaxID=2593676 RepID=UPI00331CE9E4
MTALYPVDCPATARVELLADALAAQETFMPRMIGRHCPDGSGGRDCRCCGQPPGHDHKSARRRVKRSERQQWKRATRLTV